MPLNVPFVYRERNTYKRNWNAMEKIFSESMRVCKKKCRNSRVYFLLNLSLPTTRHAMAFDTQHSTLAQRPYSSGIFFFFTTSPFEIIIRCWTMEQRRIKCVCTYARIYLFEQVWACFKSEGIMLRQPYKIPYLNAKSKQSFIVDTMATDTGADVILLMALNVVK